MGDSSPASHGPTLTATALTPTTRPSFLPTLLAEISLGHFIQWGREGHPTDNYSLLNLSRLCLPRALPLLWIHVWPCHCHFVISTNVNCLVIFFIGHSMPRGRDTQIHFILTRDARRFRKDTGCMRGILDSEFQEPYHSILSRLWCDCDVVRQKSSKESNK